MSRAMPDRSEKISDVRAHLEESGALPEDLERFDAVLSRRKFFGVTGAAAALTGLGAGADAALRGLFGRGLVPVAWAQDTGGAPPEIPGKEEMTVHFPQPINGEFAPHLLDDDVTPTNRHFVRNSGTVPVRAQKKDLEGWTLRIDGEVRNELELTLDDLKAMPSVTGSYVIECGGNGRANFDPPVRGNPWDRGAVACSRWTGVPLRHILERAGLKESAVYTAHYGEDLPLGKAEPFSRGIPIEKALDEHTIVAYRQNGADLHPLNGFPVRLVVPGWVGSCSQKWLNRIWVRDRVHDSQKMKGFSYRLPRHPVKPGTRPPEEEMVIATSWIVKSMITSPAGDAEVGVGGRVVVTGHAWAGDGVVARVAISTDYGVTWKDAALEDAANRYAWQSFESDVKLAGPGYYEIWARAFDTEGGAQPFRQPWNPRGYLGNVIHRIPITATG